MGFPQERYFRQVTSTVMAWYVELGAGVIEIDGYGRIFAPELINYRIDVENSLKQFTEAERNALMSVHRDGVTREDAVRMAGLQGNPKSAMVALEVRAGRTFERLKLNDLVGYLKR